MRQDKRSNNKTLMLNYSSTITCCIVVVDEYVAKSMCVVTYDDRLIQLNNDVVKCFKGDTIRGEKINN